MMADSTSYIGGIEGSNFCESISGNYSQEVCETALNGILKTGVTQTMSTMMKSILQSQINF